MSRPTEDILDDIDPAETGSHGCLFPTGDACDEGGECEEGDSDE